MGDSPGPVDRGRHRRAGTRSLTSWAAAIDSAPHEPVPPTRHHQSAPVHRTRSRPNTPAPDTPSRYSPIIVSIEELQISIERHLEELSEQVERLRAALEALDPGDPAHVRSPAGRTPRATGPRERPAARLGATPHAVRANGQPLSAVAIAGSGAGPASSPPLSPVASEARTLSAEGEDRLLQVAANDPAAGAAEGEDTAPVTGADRALHELRSELAAGLRNGRG